MIAEAVAYGESVVEIARALPFQDVEVEDIVRGGCESPVSELRDRLKDIHNYIYANDRFKQHAKVFDELTKLLLAKLHDERHGSGRFVLAAEERRTATRGTNHEFSSRLDCLFRSAVDALGVGDLFAPRETLQLSPRVLAYAVSHLSEISLLETDAKGAAFQAIIGPQVRGEKGQFFTPDPVKRLITQIIDPAPEDTLLDPACGSGGLLATSIAHVRRKLLVSNGIAMDRRERTTQQHETLANLVDDYARMHVFGMEIDPHVARVARLNMALHGEGHTNVFIGNALAPWSDIARDTQERLDPGSIDVVVTNPPFGTRGKVDDRRILSGFPYTAGRRQRQVPDILYLERIVQFLKPGGRAGIVLPYGDLANSSLGYVRDFLRTTCHVFAAVSLPSPTFKPAENSVKAGVLFIRKWIDKPARYPTFRAVSTKIGYDMHERPCYRRDSRGRYISREGAPVPDSKIQDARWMAANAVIDEDISDIIHAWRRFRRQYGAEFLW